MSIRKMIHLVETAYSSKQIPSVFGVGYIGVGLYKSQKNGRRTKEYIAWSGMMMRSYYKPFHDRYTSYIDCGVCEEWHNFQNFAMWYENNNPNGFQLDKDIIIKGNKMYSPETCCFVPQDINSLFISGISNRGTLPMGVCRKRNKFQSYIGGGKNRKSLGSFNTINEAFLAYKIEKEFQIKSMTEKWRVCLNPTTYLALINYKIEITD